MSADTLAQAKPRSGWWLNMRELLRVRSPWSYLYPGVLALWSTMALAGASQGHFQPGVVALVVLLISAFFISFVHARASSLYVELNLLRAPASSRDVIRCALCLVASIAMLFLVGMAVSHYSFAWVLLACCWLLVLGSWPTFHLHGITLIWLMLLVSNSRVALVIESASDGPVYWLLWALGLLLLVRSALRLQRWRRRGLQRLGLDSLDRVVPMQPARMEPERLPMHSVQDSEGLTQAGIDVADKPLVVSTPADRELHRILAQTQDTTRRLWALLFLPRSRVEVFWIVTVVLVGGAFSAWEQLGSTNPDRFFVTLMIAVGLFIAAIVSADRVVSDAADRYGSGFELMQLPGFPNEQTLVRWVIRRIAQIQLWVAAVALLAGLAATPILLWRQDSAWQSVMFGQAAALALAIACSLMVIGTHLAMWVTWPHLRGLRVVVSLGITVLALLFIALFAAVSDSRTVGVVLLAIAVVVPWLCIRPQAGRATRLIRDLPKPGDWW